MNNLIEYLNQTVKNEKFDTNYIFNSKSFTEPNLDELYEIYIILVDCFLDNKFFTSLNGVYEIYKICDTFIEFKIEYSNGYGYTKIRYVEIVNKERVDSLIDNDIASLEDESNDIKKTINGLKNIKQKI